MHFLHRIRRALCAMLLACALVPVAQAATMTDLWYNPGEAGWGMNVVEQEGTLFITLFLYGPNGLPTWYVASGATETSASTGRRFTGLLYTTTGSYFGASTFAGATVRQVGTITFAASTPVSATVSYTVDGIPVTKSVQRQTFKHINLSGTYLGAMDPLSSSTCSTNGQPFYAAHALTATINSNGISGNISMTFTDTTGGSMTFSGSYVQYGVLYEVVGSLVVAGASYTAAVRDFTADDDGIRGNLLAQGASGCLLNLRFAAVRPG